MSHVIAVTVLLSIIAALVIAYVHQLDANERLRRHGRTLPTLGTVPLPRAISIPTKTRRAGQK